MENLDAPQEVCVVEVSPPNGYADAFDPRDPPSACGTVEPGQTLELRVTNVADAVPVVIPAGQDGAPVVHSATTSSAPAGAVAGLGVLAVLVSAVVGTVARKRFAER